MADEPQVDADLCSADIFLPVASDAVRMCPGPCGDVKPVTCFPIVSGRPGARHGVCSECRDERLRSARISQPDARRDKRRTRQHTFDEAIQEAVTAYSGCTVTFIQVYERVCDRLPFPPSETNVRDGLRSLVKADSRFVKLGRDAYAWVPEGEVPPPPLVPPRVAEMIERRWRGMTLEEIGVEYDLTRERVRQLLKKYGGPTAKEVRELRAAEARTARSDHSAAVGAEIRGALEVGGPMTVSEVVAVTGIDANDVSRYWPHELSHLSIRAAGQGESRWSDDDILAALREAALYEFPLTTTAYTELLRVGQVDGPSVPRIGQRFGTWSAACARAEVVAGDPWNRDYESRWSDDDLLQVARAYLMDLAAPNSAHRFDEWKRKNAPDGPSFQTLRNRFGSWTQVKKRALAQGEMAE